MSTIAERVAKGAAHLDGREPGWDQRIDLDKLDLHSSCGCVLGQLATDLEDAGEGAGPSWRDIVYHFGLRRGSADLISDDLICTDIDHGFNAGGDQTVEEYDALTAEWKRVIAERRPAS